MHEIGPCPHYQLHGVLTLVFCIILEPHCAVLLRPEPTCAASSAPSGLATSPNFAVDLGQDIQFGSS